MPWQTYDPKSGVQTTYKGETADTGVAKVEQIPANPNFQPTPGTTTPAPVNVAPAPATATPADNTTTTPADTAKVGVDTSAPANTAKTPATPSTEAYMAKEGIANLVNSGKIMNEIDAKNLAFAKGEVNFQQYIGGTSGKANPLYIGSTNWQTLQKQYTPYQLQQATVRTKDGIYWNDKMNIGDIPRVDPSVQINADTKKLADIVGDAKKTADKLTSETAKTGTEAKVGDTASENQDTLMGLLKDQYGNKSAESVYNDLYNTPEMTAAKADVNTYKKKNDEYNQQLDELKDDIRKEVEGEAPDSYISALAAVRGDKILKLQRANQRDLDTATANLTGLKENASNLLQVRVKDNETRYNNLFQMLQLQIQEEGTAFNKETALAQIQMNLPENRTITIDGTTYKGLKENDNLNVVQFTEANGKTYVIGMDKKTGKETYRQYIGTQKVTGTGAGDIGVGGVPSKYIIERTDTVNGVNFLIGTDKRNGNVIYKTQLGAADAKAQVDQAQAEYQLNIMNKVKDGTYGTAKDSSGTTFYYDKTAYDEAAKSKNNDWVPFNNVKPEDFKI